MLYVGDLLDMSLREEFLRGEYGEIVQRYDRGSFVASKTSKKRETPWIAASLALMGRIDEALEIETVTRASVKEPIARFYIIVALIRSSEYELAQSELTSFLRETRLGVTSGEMNARFYVFQALGFRAFFEGHYKKSLYWSQKAWGLALKVGGLHERVLSADLRGHCLIQMGDFEAGLESLEVALDVAKRFGNKSHVRALRAALAIAEVQHGYRTKEELRQLLTESLSSDSYTSANVLIELVRQENLMGRYRQALKIVSQTRPLIKRVRHKRQMASLAVREAYSHFRLGDLKRALDILLMAENKLEARDRAVLIEVKGLKFQVLKAMSTKSEKEVSKTFSEVKRLAHEVRNHRSLSFVRRWETSQKAGISQAPIDRWIHGVTDYHIRRELLERGYLDFFSKLFGEAANDAVLLELVSGTVLFRVRSELEAGEDRFSSSLRRGLLILARERRTKEELLQLVWGYQYDASRHDTLIYTFIRRLRLALGPLGAALNFSAADGTYGFARPVAVKVLEYESSVGFQAAKQDSVNEPDANSRVLSDDSADDFQVWNPRQLELLAKLKAAKLEKRPLTEQIIKPKELIQTYKVSRITAGRDLAELSRKGLLVRIGSGRGTGYMLRR